MTLMYPVCACDSFFICLKSDFELTMKRKQCFKIYTLVSIGVEANAFWRCFNWLMSKEAGPRLGTHPGRGMIPLWLTIGVTFCVGVDITSTGRSLETPGVIDWPSADIPESFWSFEL